MDIQTFTVDLDDIDAVAKLASKMKDRKKELMLQSGRKIIDFCGSKYNMEKMMPIIEDIMATDLSKIYTNFDTEEKYYVYVHCDPSKPLQVRHDLKHLLLAQRYSITHEPFYVGKGSGDRWKNFNRNEGHRKVRSKILMEKQEIIATKIIENISESDALSIESKLIDILGLRTFSSSGLLVNLDEGSHPNERRNLYSTNAKKVLSKNGFYFERQLLSFSAGVRAN
jgi:hypothetical protein